MISPKAQIGAHCKIAPTAIIHDNVVLGDHVVVEDFCILGYNHMTRIHDPARVKPKLTIGSHSLIRAGAIVYEGSTLANNVQIGHQVVLREGCDIGEYSVIGNGTMCEGYIKVGKRSHLLAQCHLTAFLEVGDYVFFGAQVTTMNDPVAAHYRPHLKREVRGPVIKNGVRVGAAASIIHHVTVGEEAFLAAGCLVTKDIPPRELWGGVPARKLKDVDPNELLSVNEAERYVSPLPKKHG